MRIVIGLFLVLAQFAAVEDALAKGDGGILGDEHVSMLIWRAAGIEMASRPIAEAMAELILKKLYGEDELRTQLPLKIEDGGDRWIIEGNRRAADHLPRPGDRSLPPDMAKGKFEMEILKANCRVVKFLHRFHFVSQTR